MFRILTMYCTKIGPKLSHKIQKCKKNIFAQNFVARLGAIFGRIIVFWDANQKIISEKFWYLYSKYVI